MWPRHKSWLDSPDHATVWWIESRLGGGGHKRIEERPCVESSNGGYERGRVANAVRVPVQDYQMQRLRTWT